MATKPHLVEPVDRVHLVIALSLILPSRTNPRQDFPDAYIDELADSIRAHGVLQPILVRPIPKTSLDGKAQQQHYEIVAGECRYRAATKAKLEAIPAIVRILTDVQAREVQLIENIKRKDLHPYEEARGYRQLLDLRDKDTPVHTPESLAKAVGKSTSWIYTSAKLLDLTDVWAKEFVAHLDRFTPGHAIVVARLTPKQQEKLFKDLWKADAFQEYPSVRDLQEIIQERLLRSLAKAPFKRDTVYAMPSQADAVAVNPHAVNAKLPLCNTCPLRIGTNPALYPTASTKDHDTCTNGPCYEQKVTFYLRDKEQELREKEPDLVVVTRDYSLDKTKAKDLPNTLTAMQYTEVKPNATGAKKALVVDGRDRGHIIHIKPSAHEQRKAERGGVDLEVRRKNLEDDITRATRKKILEGVCKAVAWNDYLKRAATAHAIVEGLDSNQRKQLLGEAMEGVYGFDQMLKAIAKWTPAQLLVGLAAAIWGGSALANVGYVAAQHGDDDLLVAARELKVDIKAIEKAVRALPEFQKRREGIASLESKAKKKTPAKAKLAARKK
jgi:ParB family chromosome partitioning protein